MNLDQCLNLVQSYPSGKRKIIEVGVAAATIWAIWKTRKKILVSRRNTQVIFFDIIHIDDWARLQKENEMAALRRGSRRPVEVEDVVFD